MKVKRPELSFLKKIFLVDLIKGLAAHFFLPASFEELHRTISEGPTQGRRAVSRRSAAEQRS